MKKTTYRIMLAAISLCVCLMALTGCGSKTDNTTASNSTTKTVQTDTSAATQSETKEDEVVAVVARYLAAANNYDAYTVSNCCIGAVADEITRNFPDRKAEETETAAYFKSGLIGDCNSLLWSLNVNSDISENTQFQAACDELIDAIFEMMNTKSYLLPEKSEKKSDNEAWVTVQLQNPDGDLVDYSLLDHIRGILATKLLDAFDGESIVKKIIKKEVAEGICVSAIKDYTKGLKSVDYNPAGEKVYHLNKVDGRWLITYIDNSRMDTGEYIPDVGIANYGGSQMESERGFENRLNNTSGSSTNDVANNLTSNNGISYNSYDDVIALYRRALENNWSMDQLEQNGLNYLFAYDPGPSKYGYMIVDINGDGTDELLIGQIGEYGGWEGFVFDLYTFLNGRTFKVFSSGERDRYYICTNGTFENEWSSSAVDSGTNYYMLSSNGQLTEINSTWADRAYLEYTPFASNSSATYPSDENPDVAERFYNFVNNCDTMYFTRDDIDGFDKEMAMLARNAPYAHAGRIFTNDAIREFYEDFMWYSPYIEPDAFQEPMLNDYETENKNLMVAYEKEMGYK